MAGTLALTRGSGGVMNAWADGMEYGSSRPSRMDRRYAETVTMEIGTAPRRYRRTMKTGSDDEHGDIWIESTRGPDDEPACLITLVAASRTM